MTSFEKDFVPKFPSYHLNAQNELETYLAKHPQRIRTTTILACSSRVVDGPLCQYRRGFFDHLKPRAFVTNVGIVGWIFFGGNVKNNEQVSSRNCIYLSSFSVYSLLEFAYNKDLL